MKSGGRPYVVRFSGYDEDPREVWEIDRVIEQCSWILKVGGISSLVVQPPVLREAADVPDGLGAFEVWLISKRRFDELRNRFVHEFRSVFLSEFWPDLMISNRNLEECAKSAPDWPSEPG